MIPALCKFVGSKRGLIEASPEALPLPAPGGAVHVPFVGGGSVVAYYRSRGYQVHAGDTNARLINCHVQVRDNCERVIEHLTWLAEEWKISLRSSEDRDKAGRLYFEAQRHLLNVAVPSVPMAAALFLFIVKAGFNGLYRENRRGECNTSYNPQSAQSDIVAAVRLRAYSASIQGVALHVEDFAVTCERARAGDVVYLDPPYSGSCTDYGGGDWRRPQGTRARLAALLPSLHERGVRWTLSDSDTEETQALYARWQRRDHLRAGIVSANGKGRGAVIEGLWSNW